MKTCLLLLLTLVSALVTTSQPLVTFNPVISTGLSSPVDVVNANDGSNRLFIVQQVGTIKIWNGTSLLANPFLDVTSIISSGGERGLLSLAFHPDYKNNHYFFIYFTDPNGSIAVRRYQTSATNPNQADAATGVTLITIPKRFANHNGGKLLFGPDGYLYFGTGDGGSGGDPDNNSQNGQSLLGKLIRIDVNGSLNTPPYYTIPPTNPYVNNPNYKPEVVAVGLRNPFRYSIDRQTNNLWIADVGQDAWEEVNVVPYSGRLGANYGWSCLEGTHSYKTSCSAAANFNTSVVPVFEYPHNNTTGGFSITGGIVYRGMEFPALQGYYLCTDYMSGNGWLIRPNTAATGYDVTQQTWVKSITSFGESEDSVLYATGLNGVLYKVMVSGALPLRITSFFGTSNGNIHSLVWNVSNEVSADIYVIEKRRTANEAFAEVYRTTANGTVGNNNYNVKLNATSGEAYYRLKVVSKSGQIQYSSIVHLVNSNNAVLRAYVSGNNLYTNFPEGATSMSLFNAGGKLILKRSVVGGTGITSISLAGIPRGVIIVKVQVKGDLMVKEVIH